MNKTIKIGGVTEHFNLPWNLAVEQQKFTLANIDLNWLFYPGGTGVMTEALRSGELDMAILLTEGFISAASRGLKAKVVKEYISSPLGWGIFTGTKSSVNSIYSKLPKKYAISKFGSGSHLMALIHAEQRGEKLTLTDLVEVKTMEGAMESLTKGETQIFYWEKYTTKPFVENGTVRMIGEFSAPWSSFLIVATDEALATKRDAIEKVLAVMDKESAAFLAAGDTIGLLCSRFKMSEADATTWLRWDAFAHHETAFWARAIALRRQLPALHAGAWWRSSAESAGSGPVATWALPDGRPLQPADWDAPQGGAMAVALQAGTPDAVLLLLNPSSHEQVFCLPQGAWRVVLDSAVPELPSEGNRVVGNVILLQGDSLMLLTW